MLVYQRVIQIHISGWFSMVLQFPNRFNPPRSPSSRHLARRPFLGPLRWGRTYQPPGTNGYVNWTHTGPSASKYPKWDPIKWDPNGIWKTMDFPSGWKIRGKLSLNSLPRSALIETPVPCPIVAAKLPSLGTFWAWIGAPGHSVSWASIKFWCIVLQYYI